MDEKKKPAIRFRGFTEDWEQHKLGEIVDVRSGCDYKHLSKGNIPVYGTGGYMLSVNKALSYSEDAVGIGRKGTIDNPYILKSPFWTVDTLFYAIPRIKMDLEFTLCLFLKIDWKKKDESTGVPSLSKQTINSVDIIAPTFNEQTQLGAFFLNFNHLIGLHQHKYNKLQNIKKAILEKMFPQSGKNVPEIRFKGFNEGWKQHKVEDICSISTGKSNTQDRINDGIYPFYVRSPIIERSNRYLYDEEAVLTIGDGVGTGKVFHYVNGKYDLHQRVYRMFDFNKNISGKYFYYYFSSYFYNRVMCMTAKTSVDSVRYEMISKMNIEYPNEIEQKAITKTFDSFDNLITLYRLKLEKLQNIKKFCLEKMFI